MMAAEIVKQADRDTSRPSSSKGRARKTTADARVRKSQRRPMTIKEMGAFNQGVREVTRLARAGAKALRADLDPEPVDVIKALNALADAAEEVFLFRENAK